MLIKLLVGTKDCGIQTKKRLCDIYNSLSLNPHQQIRTRLTSHESVLDKGWK